jgi:hypothetical protein
MNSRFELSPENSTELLGSYNSCYDATIHSLHYSQVDGQWELSVFIQGVHLDGIRRYKILFIFNNIITFIFHEDNTCNTVLSDGVSVAWFGDQCYVAFAPYSSIMESDDDYRRSDFLVVSRKVTLKAEQEEELYM